MKLIRQDLEALSWMMDVAQALHHLHAQPEPVVHRVSSDEWHALRVIIHNHPFIC